MIPSASDSWGTWVPYRSEGVVLSCEKTAARRIAFSFLTTTRRIALTLVYAPTGDGGFGTGLLRPRWTFFPVCSASGGP